MLLASGRGTASLTWDGLRERTFEITRRGIFSLAPSNDHYRLGNLDLAGLGHIAGERLD